MTHRVLFPIILSLIGLFASEALLAQGGRIQTKPNDNQIDERTSKRSSDEQEEMVTFKDHLWFGGSFDLGFSGSSDYNAFILGLYPMVGYKILPALSVGPRVGIQYNYLKGYLVSYNFISKTSLVHYSLGAFARYKAFRNFFAQGEYEFQTYQTFGADGSGDIVKSRVGRDNVYIGAGYNSGGKVATEIALMYNLLEPAESTSLPFSIRFGITYKF